MSDYNRLTYRQARLEQHVLEPADHAPESSGEFTSVGHILVEPVGKNNTILAGLIAAAILHAGIFAFTQLDRNMPEVKQKTEPVVMEIVKPEPEKPKIIQPEIPAITSQPKPQPVAEQHRPELLKQTAPAKPALVKPVSSAPVLMAKADAAETKNVIAAPPLPAPEPKQEDLPLTEAKGYAGYLSNPAPDYPEIAFDRGWEGRVVLRIRVSAQGLSVEINLKQGSGKKILDDAAQRTVKRWKFAPAKRGSTPIEGWVDVPIDFKLPQ